MYLLFLQLQLLELQAEYHKNSYEFLSTNISELKDNHSQNGEVSLHQSVHLEYLLHSHCNIERVLLLTCVLNSSVRAYLIPQGHR